MDPPLNPENTQEPHKPHPRILILYQPCKQPKIKSSHPQFHHKSHALNHHKTLLSQRQTLPHKTPPKVHPNCLLNPNLSLYYTNPTSNSKPQGHNKTTHYKATLCLGNSPQAKVPTPTQTHETHARSPTNPTPPILCQPTVNPKSQVPSMQHH